MLITPPFFFFKSSQFFTMNVMKIVGKEKSVLHLNCLSVYADISYISDKVMLS